MPKRSSKPKDPHSLAFNIVARVTGGEESAPATPVEPGAPTKGGKNPAAVALGRLGGLKGGNARAEALSDRERSAIAKKAALARWKAR